ncbi:hypothetical protein IWW45_001307 [Coemansia sp. RSA 485]|nr:hypothetical protein IWW45_001307 [Coemansia sp. RSA 485]
MLFEFDNFGWTNITDIRICLTPYGEEGDLMDDEQTQNNLYQTIIRFAHILHEAMPRVVNVQLSIEPRFLPGSFGVLQNTFCTTAYQWPNIQSLEIEGYGDMDLLMGNDDPVVLNQNIQTLTQSVAMQMPLINKIRMSGFIESEESRSLRHLELDNLAHGFSWSAFSNHETNGCIRFSRLEQFNIIYNTNVVDFHSDYQYFAYRHIYEITEIPAECPRLRKIYMGNASYCSLQNVLCFGSSPWDSVDTLEIELANFENIHNVDVHLPVFHSCLKHFAQQIVQAIPNVKSLYCGGDRTNPAENMLYVTLISGYFDQLNRLLSTTLVVPTIFENKNKFKSLDLVFSGSQHVISNPKICVNDLDKLQLTNVPADFSWSWFTDARGLTDISFDSLTNFSLDLNASAASDSGIQRMETDDMQQKQMYICLPKITSIIIKAKDPNNDLASSSLVIQNAGSIALKGPVGAMPRCANSLTYSVANYLDIDVSAAGSNDENQFYLVTNSWLQSKSFINRSWLKINNLGFSLDASLVRWNSLCSLDICCDIAFGTLVDLLSRLVCLDTLHVDRLYAAEMIPAISTIEAVVYTCALIAPVSTSVKSLEISGFADGCVSHVLAASIKYLLLVIPSLDKMYVPEEVAFSIDSFVKQLGHTYPHLGSITFN